MRFLFTTANPFVPDILGGAEVSVDGLARGLVARGHVCEVVSAATLRLPLRWCYRAWRVATLGIGHALPDRRNPYWTWRATREAVPDAVRARIRAFGPDVVLCWNRGAEEAAIAAFDAGAGVIVWVPDVSFKWYRGGLPRHDRVVLAGCSDFVVGQIGERLGITARRLRPLIDLDAYCATDPRQDFVTHVNPTRPKGLEVVLAVARLLPHRAFLILDSWHLGWRQRASLVARLAHYPNVTLRPSTPNMAAIYGRTSVLLVPSQIQDASPRVVLEAQVNGIPVVGSRIGGIPEVLGDGGVLVEPSAPPAEWAAAIEQILAVPGARSAMATRALANAARPEFGREAVIDEFLEIVRDVLGA